MAIITCPECGKEISDTAKKCIHCGYKLKSNAKKEKKRISKKALVSILGTVAILAVAAIIVITSVIIPNKNYKLAEEALLNGDFDGAATQFSDLGNYKDSQEKVLQCYYEKGETLLARKDFSSAIAQFSELGDYEDSKERILECYYEEGKDLFAKKDYSLAIESFKKAGAYSDASTQIKKAEEKIEEEKIQKALEEQENTYQEAINLFEAGALDDALVIFTSLPSDYKDTQLYIYGIETLSTAIGSYSVNGAMELKGYSGEKLTDCIVYGTITISSPFGLEPNITKYSDVDWAVTTTINISTESHKLGRGTTTYNQTYTVPLYHIIDKDLDEFSIGIIDDTSGITVLGYSGSYSNKELYLDYEGNSIRLIETPYSYNWATAYYSDMASLVFTRD